VNTWTRIRSFCTALFQRPSPPLPLNIRMVAVSLGSFGFVVTWYKNLPFQNNLAIWGTLVGMLAAFLLYKETDGRDEYFEVVGKSMVAAVPSPLLNKINLIWKAILMICIVVVYVRVLLPVVWGRFLIYRDYVRLFADGTLSLLIAAAAAFLIYGLFAVYDLAFQRILETAGYCKRDQIAAVRSAFRMLGFYGLLFAGACQLPILILPP
jgi:hypothetical protein